jgi:nucleoside-diphosphate-sugar epimerase
MDAPSSCAVVGVGALGTRLCRQILETTDWHVTGITKTVNRHDDIRSTLSSDRLTLVARDQVPADAPKYDNVVFCAPPSGSDDYPGDVKDAVENLWAGQDGGGVFAFTSTGGM